MDFSAKALGQALQDVPLGTMVGNLGLAIADAQERLDGVAIAATLRLASETTTMLDADGNTVTRSLLELGFTPTFYQFTEATIEVSFIASMHESEALSVGFGLDIGGHITNAADGKQALADIEQKRQAVKEDVKNKQLALDHAQTGVLEDLRKRRDGLPAEMAELDKLIGAKKEPK